MAERQFGPYRLVRQIAVGGMAEIHLAKTKGIAGFEKYVALKMIHPNFAEDEQFIQMLVDEAKIAVQLTHGNIAQTFDLGRVGEHVLHHDGVRRRRGSLQDPAPRLARSTSRCRSTSCAFIAQGDRDARSITRTASAITRGKPLGIVHRDVSPQNVLVSFAGEVKLVDFGIAKATMKARQTAVGVIKGKYYYMSPEQAWGDQIDYRSDIFSAGIVLYEMITGQMLYLEEDLHRLLDMVRKADIAPPSTLRKGIPPQLERIVMHALAKDRRRALSERGRLRDRPRALPPHVLAGVHRGEGRGAHQEGHRRPDGDPRRRSERRGPRRPDRRRTRSDARISSSTRKSSSDENSVIFRVDDLKPKQPTSAADEATDGARRSRVTRQADPKQSRPPQPRTADAGRRCTTRKQATPVGAAASPPRAPTKPRDANEATRQVEPAPPDPLTEDSGLLEFERRHRRAAPAHGSVAHDCRVDACPGDGDDLENIGESTMITRRRPARRSAGFMMDVASEDGVDATVVSRDRRRTGARHDATKLRSTTTTKTTRTPTTLGGDEDGPTIQRDFTEPPKPKRRRQARARAAGTRREDPRARGQRAAQAARVAQDAGRRAAPQPNVLQAIVGRSRASRCRRRVAPRRRALGSDDAATPPRCRPRNPLGSSRRSDAAAGSRPRAAQQDAAAAACSRCSRRQQQPLRRLRDRRIGLAARRPTPPQVCRGARLRPQGYPPQPGYPQQPAVAAPPQGYPQQPAIRRRATRSNPASSPAADDAGRALSVPAVRRAAAEADDADRPAAPVRGRRDRRPVQGLGRPASGSSSRSPASSRSRSPPA